MIQLGSCVLMKLSTRIVLGLLPLQRDWLGSCARMLGAGNCNGFHPLIWCWHCLGEHWSWFFDFLFLNLTGWVRRVLRRSARSMYLNFNGQGGWYGRWNLIWAIVEYIGSSPYHGSPRGTWKSMMMDRVVILVILRQFMRMMEMQERMEHRRVVKSWKFERRQSWQPGRPPPILLKSLSSLRTPGVLNCLPLTCLVHLLPLHQIHHHRLQKLQKLREELSFLGSWTCHIHHVDLPLEL